MDMDDPWGSPWADEVQRPVATKESPDDAEEPGSSTPVKASSLALQGQTITPWDTSNNGADDGFGDWAAVPSETGISLDRAHDGWAMDLGGDTPLPKPDTDGLSAGWNAVPEVADENISKLAPSLLPEPTNITRQPSPDPWASVEVTEERSGRIRLGQGQYPAETKSSAVGDVGLETTKGELELEPRTRDISTQKAAPADEFSENGNLETVKPYQTGITANKPVETDSQDREKFQDPESELLPEVEYSRPGKPTKDGKHENAATPDGIGRIQQPDKPVPIATGTSTSQEIDHMSSRPSSSPSEQSHHDEYFAESPRTSLEEDPTRPQMPRKVSKVQELVEHFDILAKEDEPPEITSDERIEVIKQPDNDEGDMDDFGDFEDVQSDLDESVEASGLVENTARPTTPDSKVPPQVMERELQQSPETQTPKKEYGPVDFFPDPSLLNQLYPNIEDGLPSESCFIPDRVPQDSFTSTEQRKTWYRISRYGPLRKHNMGDDENYTRVNWTQSSVRVETLNIVARWIEEDRISGRVVLGGGSKAGSMFGWNDQKATPASITAAFASKAAKKIVEAPVEPAVEVPREWPKGLVRDHSASKGHLPSKPRRRSSVTPKSPETKVERQSPVANFGWNTVPESSPKFHSRSSSKEMSSRSDPIAVPAANFSSPPRKRVSLSPLSSAASAFKPTEPVHKTSAPVPRDEVPIGSPQEKVSVPPAAPKAAVANFAEEDEDWGEMISSPVTSTALNFPLPNGLRHKKSQSLSGAFTSAKAFNPTIASISSIGSRRGHRPALSFDEILKPEIQGPQSATSPEKPNVFSEPMDAFSSPVVPTQPLPAGNSDPWASADFSFFETASAPTPPVSTPLPKTIPTKTVSFAITSVSASSTGTRKSKEEMEQDRIVQDVVKGLPDLSYMLRR
ncbi:hypothetical protein LAWI1_G007518 [Lachnellula willkommii]|uniref:Uncharacterized protein n=1 Tax=Lachnellula willkommii TaxID=215461 RepID=A0A559M4V4_9HELO|nr:hypothetical protein LAWI1_G007518 [Lachnellula willkommii]